MEPSAAQDQRYYLRGDVGPLGDARTAARVHGFVVRRL